MPHAYGFLVHMIHRIQEIVGPKTFIVTIYALDATFIAWVMRAYLRPKKRESDSETKTPHHRH